MEMDMDMETGEQVRECEWMNRTHAFSVNTAYSVYYGVLMLVML